MPGKSNLENYTYQKQKSYFGTYAKESENVVTYKLIGDYMIKNKKIVCKIIRLIKKNGWQVLKHCHPFFFLAEKNCYSSASLLNASISIMVS